MTTGNTWLKNELISICIWVCYVSDSLGLVISSLDKRRTCSSANNVSVGIDGILCILCIVAQLDISNMDSTSLNPGLGVLISHVSSVKMKFAEDGNLPNVISRIDQHMVLRHAFAVSKSPSR